MKDFNFGKCDVCDEPATMFAYDTYSVGTHYKKYFLQEGSKKLGCKNHPVETKDIGHRNYDVDSDEVIDCFGNTK